MKQEYHYFKAHLSKAETVIQFETLMELYNYTELNHINSILMLMNEENKVTDFALLQNAAILKHSSEGYQSLEDYFNA